MNRHTTLLDHGRNLLNEALSPSSQKHIQNYLDNDTTIPDRNSLHSLRPSSFTSSSLPNFDSTHPQFVQIECDHRPFCLQLAKTQDNEIMIAGFTPDPSLGGGKGIIETSGLIQPGDILYAINNHTNELIDINETAKILMHTQLPATLTFRRVPIVKPTLSQYTCQDIARNLVLYNAHPHLITRYGIEDTAAMIKACIDISNDSISTRSLVEYIDTIQVFLSPSHNTTRRQELMEWMDRIHQYVEEKQEEEIKRWQSIKGGELKRIEIVSKQYHCIQNKVEIMRKDPGLRENHLIWQEYVELRQLARQLQQTLENGKQMYYLPDIEGYTLRFGSNGVYVGMSDMWISMFHARFTIETQSTHPHIVFHLSTACNGLKLRMTNFKLATEGRLPSFHCDELNIEAQIVADIPFQFDSIQGWHVPNDALNVKVLSFTYYERRINSVKHGTEHDTILKLFINRLLPSVVQQAAQNFFCVELGPLLETRCAQMILSGEIKMDGRRLELYDVPLNTNQTGASIHTGIHVHDINVLSEEARQLMALNQEECDALCQIYKSIHTSTKKRGIVTNEHSNLSIRVLAHYFNQFKSFPHIKILLIELWHQSLELFTADTVIMNRRRRVDSMNQMYVKDTSTLPSFDAIVANLMLLQAYHVDVSISISDLTFRLDLCEAAATYYTTLQRIIRSKMDSRAIELSNIEAMKDGSMLENELTALDDWYDHVNRVLSYITINVDECGVIMRGSLSDGYIGNIYLELQDLACKGPCSGSYAIPLTDLAAQLRATPTISDPIALLHDKDQLSFVKFILGPRYEEYQHYVCVEQNEDEEEREPLDQAMRINVKNTSVRVLFEVPSDISELTPGESYVPFSINLVTDDSNEPPSLKIETGKYAKCQYKAERVTIIADLWRILKRRNADGTKIPIYSEMNESKWIEYLDSPFCSIMFRFFSSCQVTRNNLYWSINSASLSETKVAQVRHRVCLLELLQDIGINDSNDVISTQRQEDIRYRRPMQHIHGSSPQDAVFRTLSGRLSPQGSTADTAEYDGFDDRVSESFHSEENCIN